MASSKIKPGWKFKNWRDFFSMKEKNKKPCIMAQTLTERLMRTINRQIHGHGYKTDPIFDLIY